MIRLAIALLLCVFSSFSVAAPSVSVVDCGTSASISTSVDFSSGPNRINSGTITIGSGPIVIGNAYFVDGCTIGFVTDWKETPNCVATPVDYYPQDTINLLPSSADLTFIGYQQSGKKISWVCVGLKK